MEALVLEDALLVKIVDLLVAERVAGPGVKLPELLIMLELLMMLEWLISLELVWIFELFKLLEPEDDTRVVVLSVVFPGSGTAEPSRTTTALPKETTSVPIV